MTELSVFESLSLCTIRIECTHKNGARSSGTGFFVKYVDHGDTFVPAIITNKHVVTGAETGYLYFTLTDAGGRPNHDKHHVFSIENFQKPWLEHPDPNVDLCAMPINVFVDELGKKGIKPFITFLELNLIPTELDIAEMTGFEKIVMVGYPNGLWDMKHNQPVLRSGVLASHYKFDWNGKKEFVIDAACVPGSSGSPVLIADVGQVYTRQGLNVGASRIKFLGVLYAGPVLSANGSIEIIPAPTFDTVQARTNIPINLGYVIKSEKVRDFEDIFKNELGKFK
ncbi:MAG: trypsin-like peptidase domain-containing protein [Bacteroidales bacterium]|nr:trypsin-like peptidase domain-containing protein [Bacteroidales bacterium]